VVIAIIVILLAIAVPSMRAVGGGVQISAGKTTLRSMLVSARAEAQARGFVVGVRFQRSETGRTYGIVLHPLDPLTMYMPETSSSYKPTPIVMFAPKDREPVKFPQGVELAADLDVDRDSNNNVNDTDRDLNLTDYLPGSTTFTVLFGPNGQLVVRPVAAVQRRTEETSVYNMDVDLNGDGWPDSLDDHDSIFEEPRLDNHEYRIRSTDSKQIRRLEDPPASGRFVEVQWMFKADDRWVKSKGPNTNPVPELSVNELWIYDQTARADAGPAPWSNYLKHQADSAHLRINPYTGQLEKASY